MSPVAWVSALAGSIAGYKLCFDPRIDWSTGILRFLAYPVAFALVGWAYNEAFKADPGLNWFKLITLPVTLAYIFIGIPVMVGWVFGGALGATFRLVGFTRER